MTVWTYFRRRPLWSGGAALALLLGALLPREVRPVDAEIFSMVGTRGSAALPAHSGGPRVNVFETDAWRHSLRDGRLQPVPRLPMPVSFGFTRRTDLLRGARFTPAAYLAQIETLQGSFSRQRDVLMYYGGIRRRP